METGNTWVLCMWDNNSDPTYEAWKHLWSKNPGNIKIDSDPTYEAWKQTSDSPLNAACMAFRSYLWGMETFDFRPLLRRSIKPFRSYLWGMETRHNPTSSNNYTNSDPTYEAWKLQWASSQTTSGKHSDPTYEAWKLTILVPKWCRKSWFRSYLWGMETRSEISGWAGCGSFRSYLWGMETPRKPPERIPLPCIPILPMRHGNHRPQLSPITGLTHIPILPMRHGNLFCREAQCG